MRTDIANGGEISIDTETKRDWHAEWMGALVFEDGQSHFPGGSHSPQCMVFLLERCIEDRHDCIANESRYCSLFIPDFFDHNLQVAVEQIHHLLRRHRLA